MNLTFKDLLTIAIIFLLGCSGPVTRLRNTSKNIEYTEIVQIVDNLIYLAEQAALFGDSCVTKHCNNPVAVKRELKSRDRRFKLT
jgi:hypothetical protein